VGRELKSPKHERENMLDFKKDWVLWQTAHGQEADSTIGAGPLTASNPTTGISAGGNR
jgi:hypothetical protein